VRETIGLAEIDVSAQDSIPANLRCNVLMEAA